MKVVELLDRAEELGATFTLPEPGRLYVSASEALPDDLVQELTENKPVLIEYIRHRAEFIDLPWPLGYGGLPQEEVAKAERDNDRIGMTDKVDRRLNVLSWMRCYFRDRGDVEMAQEMKDTYHELRHADPSIQEICGICEYQTNV